jgi:serine/threonine protein kinase
MCSHENIVQLIEHFETQDHYYIVFEYMEGGSLFSFMQKRKFRLSEKFSKYMTK